ncbi:MAG: LamG-like jellyroll fold domain-containing protein [Planctomycetota bacterium]|jgi:hypothetical protein
MPHRPTRSPRGITTAATCLIATVLVAERLDAAPPRPLGRWIFTGDSVRPDGVGAAAGPTGATITGARVVEDDELGQSLRLDGFDDGLVLRTGAPSSWPSMPREAITVTAWVSLDETTRWGGIIGAIQDNGEAEQGWLLGYDETTFSFALASTGADDGDGRLTYLAGSTPVVPGRWHHVAGVYDGRTMKLYVDGALEGMAEDQSGAILYPERARYVIGAYHDDNELYRMNGRVREIAVYDRALVAEAIRADRDRGAALAALPPALDTRLVLRVAPYLQAVAPDGVTVMWETSRPAASIVQHGTTVPPEHVERVEGPATIHEVRLTGLEPGTPYFYRAVSEDELGQRIESATLTFQTAVAPDAPFGFVVIGDTQASPEVVAAIAGHAWALRPNFAVIAGDLVSTGSDRTHWTGHFFPNMGPLIGRVAFFPVLGNHEQDADWYYRYMSLPEPEYRYEFAYGNAHFFMVDANKPLGPESEQHAWLDGALAASQARWKFVVHHQPAYTSDENDYGDTWTGSSTHGDTNVRSLVPLYEKHGVDIVFNGHIHVYERTWPIRDGRVVESGGVIYVTTGGGGGGLEQFAPTRPWFSNTIMRGHHFCSVSINGGSLQFKAFDVDGHLFDTFELRKSGE